MNSTWDFFVLIGAVAVAGVGLYVSIPRVVPLKTREGGVICCALLLGVGLAGGVVASKIVWDEWLHCNLTRTPLEGRLSDARSITYVTGVQSSVRRGMRIIHTDSERPIAIEAQSASDDGDPQKHILRLLSRRGLLTPATATKGRDVWLPRFVYDPGTYDQAQRTYGSDHGLWTEYVDGSGKAWIHVLLRKRAWDDDPSFSRAYHEEIFDARSGDILVSVDFYWTAGPARYLTTPIMVLAASALEVGVIAGGVFLWRALRRRRTLPGGFPVVLPAQSAGPPEGGKVS